MLQCYNMKVQQLLISQIVSNHFCKQDNQIKWNHLKSFQESINSVWILNSIFTVVMAVPWYLTVLFYSVFRYIYI